jgi:polysaccharide biosynthesis transport protein
MADILRKYLTILWHWAWLIGVSVVLGSVVAYTMSQLTPVMYRATTTVLVNAPANTAVTDPSSILITNDRLVLTFASMMTQEPVLEEAVTTLHVAMSAAELKQRTTVTPVKNTQLIQLAVEDGNPQQAADLANTLPVVFSRQNAALQAERYAAAKANLTQQMDTLTQQID